MTTNRKFTAALVLIAGTFAAIQLVSLVGYLHTVIG